MHQINPNLSDQQKSVLFDKGTEAPFSGEFVQNFKTGEYSCANCGNVLFDSNHKFHSDCGWPSFDQSIKGSVNYRQDNSHDMVRTEVICTKCGGHLGHVFPDGPIDTTGRRYCINSLALDFKSKSRGVKSV